MHALTRLLIAAVAVTAGTASHASDADNPRDHCRVGGWEQPPKVVLPAAGNRQALGIHFKIGDMKICANRFEVAGRTVIFADNVRTLDSDGNTSATDQLVLDPRAADAFIRALAEAWLR